MRDAEGEERVFVNPVIVREEGMQLSPDGCLSFPGLPLCTVRPTFMVIDACTTEGEAFTTTFGAPMTSLDEVKRVSTDAFIASHEIDHLDGKMLVDRLSDEAFALAQSEYRDIVHSESWAMRLPADGEEYQAEKQRKLMREGASDELRRLMAEHGKRHGSAAAAAQATSVRGSEEVRRAHARGARL